MHVLLSTCTGVGGCEWPISAKVSRIMRTSCALRKRAPSSASAADAATNFKIAHVTATLPLSLIGFPFVSMLPRKKYLPARGLPRVAVRYDASE